MLVCPDLLDRFWSSNSIFSGFVSNRFSSEPTLGDAIVSAVTIDVTFLSAVCKDGNKQVTVTLREFMC